VNKQFILDEVKRTARENGGTALGIARFTKVTGIKATDWQKYWVRWGDTLHEAGFRPNKIVSAYKSEVLIEKVISLTRELGHFPVQGELDLMNFDDQKR
jgi:hypothetical protein